MTRPLTFFGPALVFGAAALWATDAPFRTELTSHLASNFIVLAEHAISCLIALPLLIWNWRSIAGLTWKEWLCVLVIGVGGSALAAIAFTESFHYVNPSVSIVLQKVQPLIAILLAWWLLGERMHKNFWLWTAVALFGAYIVSFPNLVPQLYPGEAFNPNVIGAALALSAALIWGASTVLGKYVLRTQAFHVLTSLRFVVGLIFLLLLNVSLGTFPSAGQLSGTDIAFLLIVAFTSGVVSLFIYYYGLKYTRASIATIAELGFPLAAVFVNAYFIPGNWADGTYFGLYPMQWLGTLLLLVAMLMLSRVNQAS